ncbi:N-acetylglucosamine kinase [Paenibacillus kandeliae]|uniref:N-acetylglucosamine kinase n=1 Tax=Paenibacillus kandeliae TaxID=3231269 RepID=UPI0034587047
MQFVLGLDSGGTRTEVMAWQLDGVWIGSMQGAAGNPKSVLHGHEVDAVMDTIVRLLTTYGLEQRNCIGIGAGIAGVYTEEECEAAATAIRSRWCEQDEQIAQLHQNHTVFPIQVINDAEIALLASNRTRHGIIAIAGTGSIVLGILPSGERVRSGGWGHILGDQGSGYAIGLRSLQTVMLSYDGVLPPTKLTEDVLTHYGVTDPPQLRDKLYTADIGKQHIAAVAGDCLRVAAEGDMLAQQIVTDAAQDMALSIIALRNRQESLQQMTVTVSGSMFTHSEWYRTACVNRLHMSDPHVQVIPLQQSPCYGAAMLVTPALFL